MNGFFAFRSLGYDHHQSWLLTGIPENPIVLAMALEINLFFLAYGGYRHYWDLQGFWRLFHFIEKHAGRHNHEIWRSYLFRRFLKAAPYFFSNYLTGAAIRRSPEARADFESLGMPFGEAPHTLQSMTPETAAPSLEQVRALLDSGCPVQKLTSKRFVEQWAKGGILDLLGHHGRG